MIQIKKKNITSYTTNIMWIKCEIWQYSAKTLNLAFKSIVSLHLIAAKYRDSHSKMNYCPENSKDKILDTSAI